VKESKKEDELRIEWAERKTRTAPHPLADHQIRLEFGTTKSGELAVDCRVWIRGSLLGIPTNDFVSTTEGIFLSHVEKAEIKSIVKVFEFIARLKKSHAHDADRKKTKK